MTNISNFKIGFSTNSFWLIFVVLLFIGFSLVVYRWTNPPVTKRLRYFLLFLRICALSTLLFLIFEPNLSLRWFRFQKPLIAILADNSASMQLVDASGDRAAQTNKILRHPLFKNLEDENELRYFRFDNALSAWKPQPTDSLTFNGDGTDIQEALQKLHEQTADQYLKAVVMLTDGADNLGENPLRYAAGLNIPVFPIAIGDAVETKDVVITNVFTNQITYKNNRVPVEVTIKSVGYNNQRIQVLLKKAEKIIETKQITLSGKTLERKIEFSLTPKKEGVAKYQIEIPPLDGEITTHNNRKDFYLKVLKSRMKILIIAGAPSADFSFLKQTLTADENIKIETFVEKKDGSFYEGKFPAPVQLKQFDGLIMLGFPRRQSRSRTVEIVTKAISQHQIPALFLADPAVDYRRLNSLRGIFPVTLQNLTPSQERNIHVGLTPAGTFHPVFATDPNASGNSRIWENLPPVYYSYLNLKLNPAAKVVAEIDKLRSNLPQSLPQQPVMAFTQIGAQKIAVILAHGLWRWRFLMVGLGKDNQVYASFFNKLIRWLVTREESKRVRIHPEKEIYRGGEPVTFQAEVYSEDYQPLDGAEVKIQLLKNKLKHELTLIETGSGKYTGTIQVLEGGDYHFQGQAFRNSQTVGADSGKFSVEPFSLEFQNTRMEETLLKRLAVLTDGHYFTAANFDSLTEYIQFPPKKNIESREWELWNKLAFMIALIAFLTVEWFVRKKKGML